MSLPAPQLSVVVPVLNEEGNLGPLFARLFSALEALTCSAEVVLVDDGSTDATLGLACAEQARRTNLRVVSFARNYGQHAAVLAGFEAARGEWVVTLDADLQNPPEEIARIVACLREGHDLVNTIRQERDDPLFRRLASRAVNAFARRCSGVQLNDFGCMLRGYHRSVVEPMIRCHEFGSFIPALAMQYSRRPTEIPVAHASRAEGESKYSLAKLWRLQLNLITTFSLAPLRVLFSLGALIALLGVGLGALLLCLRLILGSEWAVDGVFTLFAILFVFVGAQFFAFGVLGEYIGRIYQEVRSRPTFLLREGYTLQTAERADPASETGEAMQALYLPSSAAEPKLAESPSA